jgi:hypothetical protein
MLSYLEAGTSWGIRGIVTSSATGLPVYAKVTIQGNTQPVFSDPDVGDYHRLLLPGTYTLTIAAPGYTPQTLNDVVVSSGSSTRLDVALVPIDTTPPAASGSFEFESRQAVNVQFNEGMNESSISVNDLVLDPLSHAGPDISPLSVAYDAGTRVATFLFDGIIPDGNYQAKLLNGSVSDLAGNSLAAEYSFNLFVLAGDANRDRTVDITDLGILATNWQQSPRVFSQGDFNYDNLVDITDLGVLATNWQKTESPPAPARLHSFATIKPKRVAARGLVGILS